MRAIETTPKSRGPSIAARANVNIDEKAFSPQFAPYAHFTAFKNDFGLLIKLLTFNPAGLSHYFLPNIGRAACIGAADSRKQCLNDLTFPSHRYRSIHNW